MDTSTRLAYRWLTRLGRASPHRILEDALAGPEPDLAKIKAGLEGVLKAVQAALAGKKAPMSKSTEEYIILISKQDPVGFGVLRTVATQFFQGDITLEDLAKKFREVSPTSWDTDKVLREPLFITPYAKSKAAQWDENFAEAFAHFVMNKPLPPEIQDIMEGLR